jgi:uncharacterized protein YcbX
VYPIKGCRGIALDRATIGATGLRWDRHWMLVRPDGRFVTQREYPQLARVMPELRADTLRVSMLGSGECEVPLEYSGAALSVVVWRDRVRGIDCGDHAAAWFSRIASTPLRLVAFDPVVPRLSNRAYAGDVEARTEFSDGYAVLVTSEESLADLNARLPVAPLPMNRFRPNVVVRGGEAYGEDRWRGFAIGAARLRGVKPCTRCVVTTTDQDSGVVQGEEPLRTLKAYRFNRDLLGVTFGQNAIVLSGAGTEISVGMPVAIDTD